MVCGGLAGRFLGSGELSARGDLFNSAQLFFALRHVCESLPLHSRCCSRRLHTWLLRNRCILQYVYSRIRHGLVLSALRRKLLVRVSLYLWSRCSVYVEFRIGLEHHDRRRLHQLLPLLLSVVGTLGLLRALLLGAGLGSRLRGLCWYERIRPMGQYRLREYSRRLGESLQWKLWCGKPSHFPVRATRHCWCSRARCELQRLYWQHSGWAWSRLV